MARSVLPLFQLDWRARETTENHWELRWPYKFSLKVSKRIFFNFRNILFCFSIFRIRSFSVRFFYHFGIFFGYNFLSKKIDDNCNIYSLFLVSDYQFPIDVSGVAKDHPFLEADSLQSLFRRLHALNRCANMKIDTHHTHSTSHSKSVSTLF